MDFSLVGHLPWMCSVVTEVCERDQPLALSYLNYSFSRGWMCQEQFYHLYLLMLEIQGLFLEGKVSKEEMDLVLVEILGM